MWSYLLSFFVHLPPNCYFFYILAVWMIVHIESMIMLDLNVKKESRQFWAPR